MEFTYLLGLELTGGTVTQDLLEFVYVFNSASIYVPLSGYTAIPVWYMYDAISLSYEKVTDPSFTASITSRSLSTGDTSVTLGTDPSVLTLGGNYGTMTFPNNDLGVIYHNGILSEYRNESWGNTVQLQNVSNFGELDAITKFFLEASPKIVEINVNLIGSPGGGPSETKSVVIKQPVNNLSLNSEALNSYVSQTYFGRNIYPVNFDGTLNNEYFDGMKYE